FFYQPQMFVELAAEVGETGSLEVLEDKTRGFEGCVHGLGVTASRLGVGGTHNPVRLPGKAQAVQGWAVARCRLCSLSSVPRREWGRASSMCTSTNWPIRRGLAERKLTMRFCSVRPCSMPGSFFE